MNLFFAVVLNIVTISCFPQNSRNFSASGTPSPSRAKAQGKDQASLNKAVGLPNPDECFIASQNHSQEPFNEFWKLPLAERMERLNNTPMNDIVTRWSKNELNSQNPVLLGDREMGSDTLEGKKLPHLLLPPGVYRLNSGLILKAVNRVVTFSGKAVPFEKLLRNALLGECLNGPRIFGVVVPESFGETVEQGHFVMEEVIQPSHYWANSRDFSPFSEIEPEPGVPPELWKTKKNRNSLFANHQLRTWLLRVYRAAFKNGVEPYDFQFLVARPEFFETIDQPFRTVDTNRYDWQPKKPLDEIRTFSQFSGLFSIEGGFDWLAKEVEKLAKLNTDLDLISNICRKYEGNDHVFSGERKLAEACQIARSLNK